jgi:hypothetical protein
MVAAGMRIVGGATDSGCDAQGTRSSRGFALSLQASAALAAWQRLITSVLPRHSNGSRPRSFRGVRRSRGPARKLARDADAQASLLVTKFPVAVVLDDARERSIQKGFSLSSCP